MNQLFGVWDALEPRKRFTAILAAVAVFAAVLGLARVVNTPSMSLLYSGLDPASSGQVVSALEGMGAPFEVRGNAIYIESGRRDQVRMALASEGMPANRNAGYELLDGLSGFGTTSQMFDAAYWRAKEGELARTILASPNVAAARVHIANPSNRPFDRSATASASVIVTMGGGNLGTSQAKGIRFLVASAVAGLTPDQVSVIDAVNGVVLAAGADSEVSDPGSSIAEKEGSLRKNIERLLAARVGVGNAIVEVSIDANMDSETITERVVDPESRVAISSDNEETSSTSSGTNGGGVTVASNLPDGDVEAGAGSSNAANNRTRARVNYEVSEILRERVKRPGEIRRINVAVLVNGVQTTGADGQVEYTPRSDDEMTSLSELVQTAMGFDAARGDTITIETMEFTAPVPEGVLAEAGALDFLAVNGFKIFQMVFLGVVAIVLGMFVLKPIFTSQTAPALAPGTDPAQALLAGSQNVAGEIELNPEVLENGTSETPGNDAVDQLKSAIAERADDSRLLLQDWLNAEDTEPEGA